MLALSETHGRDGKPDILNKVPGYELWLSERSALAKGGGGLAIFYKDTLMAHEWTPNTDPEYKYVEKERQWLLIDGDGSNRMAFLNCYIACQSFTSDAFIKWNEDLFHLISKEAIYLRQRGFMLLAMGDFNSCVGQIPGLEGNLPDVNRNFPMFSNFISETGLIIMNTLPLCKGLFTWFKRDQKSLLDYGLVDADHVQKITLFNIDEDARFACMSDHALLECEVLFQTSPKAPKNCPDVIRYNFHERSDFTSYMIRLESMLSSVDLDTFSHLSTPEMLKHITNTIHDAAMQAFGYKFPRKKKRSTLPKTIRETIDKKQRVARRVQASIISKNKVEEMRLLREFNELKTKVDKDISDLRIKRRNKFRAKLLNEDPNRKLFWKCLKNQVKKAGSISALLNKVQYLD